MKISKVRDVKTPERGNPTDAGLDFFVPNDFGERLLLAKQSIVIGSGIIAKVPENKALVAFNKSGVAVKKDLHVGACVVDEGYQGEIHINLTNVGHKSQKISAGEKIVQFLLLDVDYRGIEVVDKNDLFEKETTRGKGWKGSTGEK